MGLRTPRRTVMDQKKKKIGSRAQMQDKSARCTTGQDFPPAPKLIYFLYRCKSLHYCNHDDIVSNCWRMDHTERHSAPFPQVLRSMRPLTHDPSSATKASTTIRAAQGIDHRLPLVVLVIFMTFDSFLDIKHTEYSRRGGGVIERN